MTNADIAILILLGLPFVVMVLHAIATFELPRENDDD